MTDAAAEIRNAPPPELQPRAVAGLGLTVLDLEAQRTWYESKLGMRVIFSVPKDGQVYEHIMGFRGGPGAAVLILMADPERPPGRNRHSRVVLQVPDARALAGWLEAQGVPAREVVPDSAYFISDPEGNPVELYTPPNRATDEA